MKEEEEEEGLREGDLSSKPDFVRTRVGKGLQIWRMRRRKKTSALRAGFRPDSTRGSFKTKGEEEEEEARPGLLGKISVGRESIDRLEEEEEEEKEEEEEEEKEEEEEEEGGGVMKNGIPGERKTEVAARR